MVRHMLWLIALPFLGGILTLVFPYRRGWREAIAFIASLYTFILSLGFFQKPYLSLKVPLSSLLSFNFELRVDVFNSFLIFFASLIGFLVILYSLIYYRGREREREYYACILGSLGAVIGILLSDNLFLLLFFWGFLLLLFYSLATLGSFDSGKRLLTVVGGADILFLLGIIILYFQTGSSRISELSPLPLSAGINLLAFYLILAGILAKLGAFPFHSWLPKLCEDAPAPVLALLPGALDKFAGVYLLYRLLFNFFQVSPGVTQFILAISAITIFGSLILAFMESNLFRLLGYLSISSSGYLILGLALKSSLANAGALFYLLGTTLWTTGMFLSAGSMEGTSPNREIDRMRSKATLSPFILAPLVIFGLSVSAIPPFTGFFAKWMIYQGLVEAGKEGMRTWIIWLVIAMFGSALTIGSFFKIVPSTGKERQYVSIAWPLWLPLVVLATLSVIFGIFAYPLVLDTFIQPVIKLPAVQTWVGWWQPILSTWMIILGIFLGFLMFFFSGRAILRVTGAYIGGEELKERLKFPSPHYSSTFQEWESTEKMLNVLRGKTLDFNAWVGEWGKFFYSLLYVFLDRLPDYFWQGIALLSRFTGRMVSRLHTGILPTYVTWGLFILFILLLWIGRG